jgi:signal recognition particle receptor subunit beta
MVSQLVPGGSPRTRVVFVGPFGVGKSTAVRSVSDVPVVVVEPAAAQPESRASRRLADPETVERGEWWSGPGDPVAVVAAPGQVRVGALPCAEAECTTRAVLWLYGHTPDALDEADEWLGYLAPDLGDIPLSVAVTRLEVPGDRPALADYRPVVDRWARGAPVVSADPRDRQSVEEVLLAAVASDALLRPRGRGAFLTGKA